MDAFSAHVGRSEGRVERAQGDVVFALGELEPGWTADLAPGDYTEVAQTADLTGAGLVRVTGTLSAPAAGQWRVSLRIGGVEMAALGAWPGRSRPMSDLAANVSALTGPAEVAVRLTLVSV